MKSKAIGRLGLIIAAGLCACLWGPLQPLSAAAAPAAAQDGATQQSAPAATKKSTRPSSRRVNKKSAPTKAAKPIAEKALDKDGPASAVASSDAKPAGAAQTGALVGDGPPSAALPPSVANANAQFPTIAGAAGETPGPAAAQPTTAPDGSTDSQVVPPDEVNELDRAAADAPPAVMAATIPASTATTPAATSSDPATVGTAQMSSATSNDGAWDKASLIGKIFIAAGGLLTLASAARMFMA